MDLVMGPSTMLDCSILYCDWVTLLKSTLLLSLLTPALDGLLSIALLPSRLFGSEFGDATNPGRDRARGVEETSV